MDGEVWHLVEGQARRRRADHVPHSRARAAPELTRIFVVEMPYPITEMSRLPNAAAYRRLAKSSRSSGSSRPAPPPATSWSASRSRRARSSSTCTELPDPNEVISRLAPFDAALGFYDDADPSWGEYATLEDLLDQAKAMPLDTTLPAEQPPARNRGATIGPATTAAVRAAAKAAVAKPATAKSSTAKSTTAKAAAKPAKAKRTTKLKKPARSANASATGKSTKPAAKKPAAKERAAKKPSKRR